MGTNGKKNYRLTDMFEHQWGLIDKFYQAHFPGYCQDVDNRHTQSVIREYAGWIMEELVEALEERRCHNNIMRWNEELIDGLKFIIELAILMNYNECDIQSEFDPHVDDFLESMVERNRCLNCSINTLVSEFIFDLGMFTHCLKNKPWEVQNVATDKLALKKYFQCFVADYFAIMQTTMDADTIYRLFVGIK